MHSVLYISFQAPFLLRATNFDKLCFHFQFVKNTLKFLLRFFSLIHVPFRNVLFNLQVSWDILAIFVLQIFSSVPFWSEKETLYDFYSFQFLKMCFLFLLY